MKRTNLVLDEELLGEAVRVLGARTYSATVNMALRDAVRLKRLQSLSDFLGKGLWQGDLAAMREDRPAATRRRAWSKEGK
jgi:Arc/MetJ family transcription regulator